jgi:pSer/pThr/pTyr-binding forkhead associated (FHA) protein
MSDGSTRKIQRRGGNGPGAAFLAKVRVTLVQVSGGAAGSEYDLTQRRLTLGRGPNADLAFDDSAMSRQHAALELTEEGYKLLDLGSTNGVLINGAPTSEALLKHSDRFQLGDHVFQYVLDERERSPREFKVP